MRLLRKITYYGEFSEFIQEKKSTYNVGSYVVLGPYPVFVHSDPNGLFMFSENTAVTGIR